MITNLTYDRKLRMMRADLFSILSCCTNSDFIDKAEVSQIIKKRVVKFLEWEQNVRVRNMAVLN